MLLGGGPSKAGRQHFVHTNETSSIFFNKRANNLFERLPGVHILRISSKFNTDKSHFKPGPIDGETDGEHGQDALFIRWLNHSYHKLDRVGNTSTLFFVPAMFGGGDEQWWNDLNKELWDISANRRVQNFALDHTFMAETFPVTPQQVLLSRNRNVMDIRLLRSDNDMSTNGRDIYVPYNVRRSVWAEGAETKSPRMRFIAAPCREAGGLLDSERGYRTKIYDHWKDIPDSLIKKDMSKSDFVSAFKTSDFCVIAPGDTSSTAKLYMAIFAGCIPIVFVSFRGQLPFINHIDWSLFSVVVLKDIATSDEGMNDLRRYLEELRSDLPKLRKLKSHLSLAAQLFDYSVITFPSVYHLTLLELAHGTSVSCNGRGHHVDKHRAIHGYLC